MKTGKRDFEYFKSKCELWLEVLGLMSWKIYYEHVKYDDDCFAKCKFKYGGRVATIGLNTEWDDNKVTDEMLNESALHECLELLLSPLWSIAQARDWCEDEYNKENHMIIRTLEKLLNRKRDK